MLTLDEDKMQRIRLPFLCYCHESWGQESGTQKQLSRLIHRICNKENGIAHLLCVFTKTAKKVFASRYGLPDVLTWFKTCKT
jgi:hypothetical protein